MAIDSNGDAHFSYYDSTAGDLRYLFVPRTTTTGGTTATGGTATYGGTTATGGSGGVGGSSASITATAIDSAGVVGEYSSVAVDSNNKVHISYYDVTNDGLKYATNESGSWTTANIDTANAGKYTSLAVDSNNKLHISYYGTIWGDLKYATNESGSWVVDTIDSTDDVGYYTSIAVDSNNKVHISYYSNSSSSGASTLKYATNLSGSWVISTVPTIRGNWGYYTGMGVDADDHVHISYCFAYSKDSDSFGSLGYATNESSSWATSLIDSSTLGEGVYSSLAIDSNSKVHISYSSNADGTIKYATNASGAWNIGAIGKGVYSSLVVDSNDHVHIGYYDVGNNTISYATNRSGKWVVSGVYTVGYWTISDLSMAIDSNGDAHFSYYDSTASDLRYLLVRRGP
jgi:hypothetical protein